MASVHVSIWSSFVSEKEDVCMQIEKLLRIKQEELFWFCVSCSGRALLSARFKERRYIEVTHVNIASHTALYLSRGDAPLIDSKS